MWTRRALLTAALTASPAAWACLNDSDSRDIARRRKKKLPAVVRRVAQDPRPDLPSPREALSGRFDRHPAAYYARRMEIAAALLEQDPRDLGAWDDAAVAADRLHDADEAIRWIQGKREILDDNSFPEDQALEHEYAYAANLGTFLAHRWLRDGADRVDSGDLQQGRALIARAIELKPDAHFGRERYQLVAMDWLLAARPWRGDGSALLRAAGDPAEAIEGLSGLIALGAAWESVDVTFALALALRDDGQIELAARAMLRVEELIGAGRGSLVPGAPPGDALAAALVEALAVAVELSDPGLRYSWAAERMRGDVWQDARAEYVTRRVDAGEHPDITAGFWDGWDERAVQTLAERRVAAMPAPPMRLRDVAESGFTGGALGLALVGGAGWLIERRRRLRWADEVL